VASATTFGLFVGAPWAWVGYAAAAAVLVAMFVRSHGRHRVVTDPYELRADVTAR
jgi:uncharacterized membrane protein YdjX (TVP38/TMEM64 family)